MKKPTVFDVANYFLSMVNMEAGSVMTHLKLQKLCYYAQAWNLAFDSEPIFHEDFQAWAHGPVCSDLWHAYKEHGFNPIPKPNDFNKDIFSPKQQETLEVVWENYGQFEAKRLEELTHQEDPWIFARGKCKPGETCTTVIDRDSMQKYYTSLLENEQ